MQSYALFACVALIGWITAIVHKPDTSLFDSQNATLNVIGTVENVSEYSSGLVADIKVTRQIRPDSSANNIRPFKVRTTIPSIMPSIMRGDIVRFSGSFQSIRSKRKLPDEIDLSANLLRKGISAKVFVEEDKIVVIGKDRSVFMMIKNLRNSVNDLIYTSGLSPDVSDFLSATLTGDSSALSPHARELFSAAGLAHILALSGAHVMIIAFVLSIGLFPLTFFRFCKLRIILTIVCLWLFAIMTGLSPSVTRAVIMTTIVSGAYLTERRNSSMNALIASAILILLFDPASLFSPGFQLSFAAVAAILLLHQRLNPFDRRKRLLRYIASIFLLPCVAMLATAPVAAFYFHYFPSAFILASVPVTFLLTLIISAGVLLVILTALSIPHSILNDILDFLYNVSTEIMDMTVSLPGSVIDNIYLSEITVILFMFVPLSLAAALHYRRSFWFISTFLIAVTAFATIPLSKPCHNDHELFITAESDITNFLVKENNSLYLISNAPTTRLEYLGESCRFKYKDYMGLRDIDSLTIVTTPFETDNIYYDGRRLWWRGKLFVVIDSDSDMRPVAPKPQFAVVCRGFKNDICLLDSIIGCSTLVLSSDINKIRHERYCNELDEAGVNYISLRQSALFHLTD